MKIEPDQRYMLIEFEEGLIILEPGNGLKRKGAQPLCMAGRDDLIEYLGQYLTEREKGTPKREAHEKAITFARIPKGILLS